MANYWIGVVSRSHVQIGVRGGFIQLNHGKRAALQRLKAGDYLAMYSPRTEHPDGQPLQAFTALGRVVAGDVYQVEMSADFKPFRVDVEFLPCIEVPIKGLIESLSFIKDKKHWGAAFRFGYLKVPEADFRLISASMGAFSPTLRSNPSLHPRATAGCASLRTRVSSNVRPRQRLV